MLQVYLLLHPFSNLSWRDMMTNRNWHFDNPKCLISISINIICIPFHSILFFCVALHYITIHNYYSMYSLYYNLVYTIVPYVLLEKYHCSFIFYNLCTKRVRKRHEPPWTKARMGVALMKAVPLVSLLVVLRRAWRLDRIMVKNRRRGNRGNPWEKYPEIRKEILKDMKDIVYKKCAWFWLIWYRMVFDMLHALGILCALWHLFHRFKHALDLWHVLVTQAVWVPWEHFEDWNWNPDFFNMFFLLQTNWKRDMGWFGYGLYSLSLNFHSLLRSRLWILTRSAFEMWTFVELLFYIYFRWKCGTMLPTPVAASRCWCCKQDALFLLVDLIGILLAFHRDSNRFSPEF